MGRPGIEKVRSSGLRTFLYVCLLQRQIFFRRGHQQGHQDGAQAAGLAMLAAAQRNIPVALHTPTEAKLAITGNGQAQKIQVERMVTRILNLTKMPTPADAADALALAICHALRPAGALQGGEREQHLTAAQRQWAEAAQKSTRRRINHDRGM